MKFTRIFILPKMSGDQLYQFYEVRTIIEKVVFCAEMVFFVRYSAVFVTQKKVFVTKKKVFVTKKMRKK